MFRFIYITVSMCYTYNCELPLYTCVTILMKIFLKYFTCFFVCFSPMFEFLKFICDVTVISCFIILNQFLHYLTNCDSNTFSLADLKVTLSREVSKCFQVTFRFKDAKSISWRIKETNHTLFPTDNNISPIVMHFHSIQRFFNNYYQSQVIINTTWNPTDKVTFQLGFFKIIF